MTRARSRPVEIVGGVEVFAPTGRSPYHRLRWTESDGTRGDTSGGRDLRTAIDRARAIDERLCRAAGPAAMASLADVVRLYLADGRSPYSGYEWHRSTRLQIEDQLHRCLRGHGNRRAFDVTRDLLDRMRAQAGTPTMVRINTTALRALLLWGYRHRPPFFTAEQAELLPRGVVMPRPSLAGTAAPRRRGRTRRVGEAAVYIRDEDAPSATQVTSLSKALGARFPAWGALAPELACNCGPRWGEQFQLTADDAHPDGCSQAELPHLHIDWQIDSGAHANDPGGRRCRPKGEKTRIAPLPLVSFTGSPRRPVVYSAFEADHLIPAMRTAGWPVHTWTEERDVWAPATSRYSRQVRQRTLLLLPWHSTRHRFARIAIDTYRAAGDADGAGRVGERGHRAQQVLPDRRRTHATRCGAVQRDAGIPG